MNTPVVWRYIWTPGTLMLDLENEHFSTVSGLIRVECFIEITPDFLCPFELHAQSHSYWQSLVIAV